MDEVERHARFDQRVVHAGDVIGQRPLRPGRVGRSRLLGEEQRHARQRSRVAQVALVAMVPLVDALDDGQPASIAQYAGELGEPRPHALRRPARHPQPNLGLALHRVLPAVRLLDADAEDAADRPPVHHRVIFLAAPAVGIRRRQAAAGLVVGELDRRLHQPGGAHVGRSVGHEAGARPGAADIGVPQRPQLGEPGLAPRHEGAADGIGGVGRARQIRAAGGVEVPAAVLAVAVGLVGPPIGEDAVDVVARDDLAVHGGHELEVVRPERARDPQLRVGPVPARLAVGVDGNPIGMRACHVVAGRVRVGAGDHLHPHRAAAANQLAERIAGAEPGAAVMERHVGRVVGDDAAGAEAGSVGMDAAEVVEPEGEIDAAGIVLHEHQLRPAHRLVAPRRRGRPRTDRRGGLDGRGRRGGLRQRAGRARYHQRASADAAERFDEGAAIPLRCSHSGILSPLHGGAHPGTRAGGRPHANGDGVSAAD